MASVINNAPFDLKAFKKGFEKPNLVSQYTDLMKTIIKDKDRSAAEIGREMGFVIHVGDGIVKASGLNDAKMGELVEFPQAKNTKGLIMNLELDSVGIVLLGSDQEVKEDHLITSTGNYMSTPVECVRGACRWFRLV